MLQDSSRSSIAFRSEAVDPFIVRADGPGVGKKG